MAFTRFLFKHLIHFLFNLYYNLLMSLQPPSSPLRNPIVDISQPCQVNVYLDLLEQAIQLSDDPLGFLHGSKVTRIRMPKEQSLAHHEYILAEASIDAETYYFRSERTRGSQPSQTIEEIKASQDPELAKMGEKIDTLVQTPASSLSAAPLPSTAPLPSATPLPSAASSADGPYVSQISKLESHSLNSSSSLNTLTSKLGMPVHLANDHIYRVPTFDPPVPDDTLHEIHPENLTLLQFLLILNTVHEANKMYSVFAGQCYWFAHLVFLLVQGGFCPEHPKTVPRPGSDSTQSWVHISRHLLPSHPDLEGQYLKLEQPKNGMAPGTWMSVFVVQIQVALVRQLKLKFDSRWTETLRKVSPCFYFVSSSAFNDNSLYSLRTWRRRRRRHRRSLKTWRRRTRSFRRSSRLLRLKIWRRRTRNWQRRTRNWRWRTRNFKRSSRLLCRRNNNARHRTRSEITFKRQLMHHQVVPWEPFHGDSEEGASTLQPGHKSSLARGSWVTHPRAFMFAFATRSHQAQGSLYEHLLVLEDVSNL